MKVKEKVTGATLETDNAFVIEQWRKYPEWYTPLKHSAAAAQPVPPKDQETTNT